MVEDGTIKSTYDTDEYRQFLEYYNKLASEGLLDVEGFSQTPEQLTTKKNDNRVGVYIGWSPSAEEAENWVAMVAPQGIEGVEPRQTGCLNMFYGVSNGFVASADCENIEALLHWWNYISSDPDLKYTARYGEEGYEWWKDENGNYHTGAAEGVEFDAETRVNPSFIKPQSSPYVMPSEVFVLVGNLRADYVSVVADYMLKDDEILTDRPIDAEKKEERSFIQTDLMAYVQQFMADSVINGITDASWDTYLDELKNYGCYEWLDWYQAYADGEF